MMNRTSLLLGATAIFALSAGVAQADPSDRANDRAHDHGALTASEPGQMQYGNGYNYGYDDGYARRDRNARYRSDTYHAEPAALLSVDLNGIAFGYRDGYWDNGHRWHRWDRDADFRSYRDRDDSNFRNGNHDRYHNDGWMRQ